jgi:sensor histidine kinase YesM
MNTSRYYYKAQFFGWSLYILISAAVLIMTGTELSVDVIGGIYLVFALGLVVSHIYRYVIIKMGWLEKDIFSLIPRVAAASILLAMAFHGVYLGIGNLAFGWQLSYRFTDGNLITWGMLFFIWSLIYFTYIFFQRFRKEEIKNLQLEAARNEYELRRLRDQMNPHFIFNAMNTIRALIDEDPLKAKNAVTQLSNVLRSSLQAGKQELIPLDKEFQIVHDYLEIEKARYEERLKVQWSITEDTLRAKIPPLLLQTIVENAIKHGIAQLPDGGIIEIHSHLLKDAVEVMVLNSGQYDPNGGSESSLGLENTRNRLQLSFGKAGWMTIGNYGENRVKTIVHLPLKNQHHDTNTDH